jgi:uncharacterized membrane protein HdeD (DUF308 family)
MKDKIKSLRLNITVPAIVSIIIGILLIVFPEPVLITFGKVIAGIIIFSGVLIVVNQIFEKGFDGLGIAVGVILALVGVMLFKDAGQIVKVIPIAIGVIMVVHGLQDLQLAVEGFKAHASLRFLPFIIAAINILLGLYCIYAAFKVAEGIVILLGIMLIFDGITDIGIVHSVRKATKDVVDGTIIDEEDI